MLWKDARDAFGKGDYKRSATEFNSVIQTSAPAVVKWTDGTTATPPPPLANWIEPAFYMLGASYFNAKDWPNAILTFKRYLKLFPQSGHAEEVQFSNAQAVLFSGQPQDAIPLFTALLPITLYHKKCTFLLADAYKQAGNLPGAVAVLEKEKVLPNLDPDYLGKINAKLLALDRDTGEIDKAIPLLQEMDADILHMQNLTDFNALAVRLGDLLLAKNNISDALNCYRRVRNNEQVIAIKKTQIADLQRQSTAVLSRIQADPLNSSDLQSVKDDIQAEIEKDEKILTEYQTLPPIIPPLFLRVARAYSAAGQRWEAAVVYRELMRQYPHVPEAEAALYGSIVVFDQLKQIERAQTLCQTYLTDYPKRKYANSVSFLRGALAYDAEQFDQAIIYFNDALKNYPDNPQRGQIEIILGDNRFLVGQTHRLPRYLD